MKNDFLTISVIVPTFNRAASLRKALRSILDQEFPKDKYEVIVVDNMSSDNTQEAFNKFEKIASKSGLSTQYLREKRKGLMYTRHAGAKVARSALLGFIDDDCLCSREWLYAIEKAFKKFDADAVGGKVLVKWDGTPPEWVRKYETYSGTLDLGSESRLLSKDEGIIGGNFCIRRDRLFECGGFNPGQLGDYLVGDSETGLVLKMHDRFFKIA